MDAETGKENKTKQAFDKNALPPLSRPLIPTGVRYSERRDNPPPGLCWYRACKDDTLDAIAGRHNLTWMDLCLLNFGTVDTGEVNWYLRYWVGCSRHNRQWYVFTGEEAPGMLLVPQPLPEQEPFSYIDEPGIIYAVAGASVRVDLGRGIQVLEQCRSGARKQPEGKWLYVFSAPGLHFEYQQIRRTGTVPAHARRDKRQPGSAFTGLFMRHCAAGGKRPDRLECEIYITPKFPPTAAHMAYIGGKETAAAPSGPERYRRAWYALSGERELEDALNQPRAKRSRHCFSNRRNLQIPYCETPRCYYFLLSPVQLGPGGLAAAMARPDALTPLIDPDLQERHFRDNGGPLPITAWRGPDLTRKITRPLSIAVVDPYAWAESIAVEIMEDTLKTCRRWIENGQQADTSRLEKITGWTPEIFYLACLLEALRKGHPEPERLDDRLKDAAVFRKKLTQWRNYLAGPAERFSARMHQHLAELDAWLKGPAHGIIDTALREDTQNGRVEDWLDVAWGLYHYQYCLEAVQALPLGRRMIGECFDTPGGFLNHCFSRYLVSPSGRFPNSCKPPESTRLAMRYAHTATMRLMGLKLCVDGDRDTPAPKPLIFKKPWRWAADFLNNHALIPGSCGVTPLPSGIVPGEDETIEPSASSTANNQAVLADNTIAALSSRAKWTAAAIEARLKAVVHMAGQSSQTENTAPFPWLQEATRTGLTLLNAYGLISAFTSKNQLPEALSVWDLAQYVFPVARDTVCEEIAKLGFLEEENHAAGTPPDLYSRLCERVCQTNGNNSVISHLIAGAACRQTSENAGADAGLSIAAAAFHRFKPNTPAAALLAAVAAPLTWSLQTGPAFVTGAGPRPARLLLASLATESMLNHHNQKAFADTAFAIWAAHSFFGTSANRDPHRIWSPSGKFRMENWPLAQQRAAWWHLAGRFRLLLYSDERRPHNVWQCQLIPGLLFDGCELAFAIENEDQTFFRALFRLPAKEPVSVEAAFEDINPRIETLERDETGCRSLVFSCGRAETIHDLRDAKLTAILRFPGEKNALGCKTDLPDRQSSHETHVTVVDSNFFDNEKG